MKEFHEMLRRITSSPQHDKMIKFVKPLEDHLGINHFWYYHVSRSGYYTYVGTHSSWNEYCFDHHLTENFPCLRHPDLLPSGISLMKNTKDVAYKKALEEAREKFNINFSINLTQKTKGGIEAFGFATKDNDPSSDERLLNQIPLLRSFTKIFRSKHKKLFDLVYDNQVHFHSYIGEKFHQVEQKAVSILQKDHLLQKLGFFLPSDITQREKDVLEWVANGYPASYIAQQLNLSIRTVENYLATIKCKLFCTSKVELINKAKEFAALGLI